MAKTKKEENDSKNERARELCDMRKVGTPIFEPGELGYACPLCGCCGSCLRWSEYKSFLWCEKCNLDIPSCLCVKYHELKLSEDIMNDRERVEKATKIFLDSVEDAEESKK